VFSILSQPVANAGPPSPVRVPPSLQLHGAPVEIDSVTLGQLRNPGPTAVDAGVHTQNAVSLTASTCSKTFSELPGARKEPSLLTIAMSFRPSESTQRKHGGQRAALDCEL
jgi:hypothetical protein